VYICLTEIPKNINGNKQFSIIIIYTTKKIYISCQFCFEIYFVGNTYKFCYEKKLQEIAVNIFVKYFV